MCSDKSMEVQLLALQGNYDTLTDRLTGQMSLKNLNYCIKLLILNKLIQPTYKCIDIFNLHIYLSIIEGFIPYDASVGRLVCWLVSLSVISS